MGNIIVVRAGLFFTNHFALAEEHMRLYIAEFNVNQRCPKIIFTFLKDESCRTQFPLFTSKS